MKDRLSGLPVKIFAVICCLFLFGTAWQNREITKVQLAKYLAGEIKFEKFVENVAGNFKSGIQKKNYYINLNGLYARLSGQITNNQIVRLENEMLTYQTVAEIEDVQPYAEKLSALNEYLSGQGIGLLYVQCPGKMDLQKELCPVGLKNYTNENADHFLDSLQELGVDYLDLRPDTAATPEMIRHYFYGTDHHWNVYGGFLGFQKVTEYIKDHLRDTKIDESLLDMEAWESHTKEEWFLGSQGKRVGSKFGGTDDFVWFTPKFPTEISCSIPHKNQFFKGDFEEANLRAQYLEKADYFNTSTYSAFIGGDYPLVQHRNPAASSDTRLLLIKDSFVLPVQCFLSTVFKEVNVVDLRHYKDGSLVDLAADIKPDLVIMMIHTGSIGADAQFEYGVDTVRDWDSVSFQDEDSYRAVTVREKDLTSGYFLLDPQLEAGTVYRISMDQIRLSRGESECVTVSLYDRAKGTSVRQRIFDVDYCNRFGYDWTFTAPDDVNAKYCLVIYPGVIGGEQEEEIEKEAMIMRIRDFRLEEGSFKNPAIIEE